MGNKITRRRAAVDELYTRPQGLYQHTDIDHKKLRRLILDAKLAPCYPGIDDYAVDVDECPICFLFYPSLNRSKCCTKGICTECFLQVKSPQAARPTQCPFCKTPNYAVEYRGVKSLEEKGVEQAEEQKVIEAKIRIRQKELEDEEDRMQRREEDIQEGNSQADGPSIRESSPEGCWRPGESFGRSSERHPEEDSLVTDSEESRQGIFGTGSAHSVMRNLGRSGAVHGQDTRLPGLSFMRINRDEEFDLDLEDIMVMEAIWLSIQDQDSPHMGSVSASERDIVSASNDTIQESISEDVPIMNVQAATTATAREVSGRNSVTGGLAGAIASLAEKQVLGVHSGVTWQNGQDNHGGSETPVSHAPIIHNCPRNLGEESSAASDSYGENSVNQFTSTFVTPTRTYTRMDRYMDSEAVQSESIDSKSDVGDERRDQSTWLEAQEASLFDIQERVQGLNSWLEVSTPHLREESHGSMSEWILDQSSEAVEVGTSFSSSIPSASELPWEAPDMPLVSAAEGAVDPQVLAARTAMLPETFEEQMMLAMALSLAEAQAQLRRL